MDAPSSTGKYTERRACILVEVPALTAFGRFFVVYSFDTAYNRIRVCNTIIITIKDTDNMDTTHNNIQEAGQLLTNVCHGAAVNGGWWQDLTTGEDLHGKRNVGELLCLIHSEISEAMEGHRKNMMDDKLPHRKMVEVELADAVIRIFDFAGGFGLDVGGAIAEKIAYNAHREDHKRENRKDVNGKKY